MLARRRPPRHKEQPQTSFPRHRKWVRGFQCIVPHCDTRERIECCHVRKGLPAGTPSWARGGVSRKPHDAFTFPACAYHHRRQHDMGEAWFATHYIINPLKEALDLARRSPCPEIREFVKGMFR